jgi:hypothetical protein
MTLITDNKKIISGLEPYDSVTGKNRIQMSSSSYYLKEEGKLSLPKSIHGFQYHLENNLLEGTFVKWLPITHIDVEEITDQRYFYIVRLSDSLFFEENKNIGFDCISKKTITHVKNNQCKIVICHHEEAFHGLPQFNKCFEILQQWCDKADIPSENVYFITGDMKSKKTYQSKVKYNIISSHGWLATNDPYKYGIVEYDTIDYLYLNFNRSRNTHRALLLTCLIRDNLLESGLNSYNYKNLRIGDYIENYLKKDETLMQHANVLQKYPVLSLDYEFNEHVCMARNINVDFYKKTFCSIVTESHSDNEIIHMSEKTWKPIINGHPFMILASKGHLECLKEEGFKTFDKWFDESYDQKDCLLERANIIVDNLKKYRNCSSTELRSIRCEMIPIIEYNYNHFLEVYKKRYINDDTGQVEGCKPITDTLLDILNNWDGKND